MRFVFDLDDTLCEGGSPYTNCQPFEGAKEMLEMLKANGHVVVIHTARGMSTYNGNVEEVEANLRELTERQLKDWEFPIDELYFGKPAGDFYVDDKGYRHRAVEYTHNLLENFCPGDT